MSQFSSNIANFFRSEVPTFTEFEKLLKESTVQEEWLTAVALYRKGIFALQKNDFNGLEIIRQANDSLKKVLDTSKETVSSNMKALNESIETFKKDSPEDLQLIKFNFGILYEDCKKIGMKSILNEENFYEEEDGGTEEALDEKIENVDAKKKENAETKTLTEEIPSDASITASATPETAPVTTPVVPTANTATTPPTDTPETADPSATIVKQKKSGYQEGIGAGKAYAESICTNESAKKFGLKNQMKQAIKDHIQQNLCDQPYNFVTSFEEGFAMGVQMQERINKDMYPEEYAKFEEESECSHP